MRTDGGLREIQRSHLSDFHWQAVETGGTGLGIPDMNYCVDGMEGWIENKGTSGWTVDLRPEQRGWINRRIRHGGRVYCMVRRRVDAGPRRGPAADEVYLLGGPRLGDVVSLRDCSEWLLYTGRGGPGKWGWYEIGDILRNGVWMG